MSGVIWEAVTFASKSKIVLAPDVSAELLIVPGPSKKGFYMGRITTKDEILHTDFAKHVDHAKAMLASKLEDLGLAYIHAYKLEPRLTYGSGWDQDALASQPGYDPHTHEKQKSQHAAFVEPIEKAMKSLPAPKTLQIPPQAFQYISRNDIESGKLKDIIDEFGDFYVVVKWSVRPRQKMKASDLVKHYKQMRSASADKHGNNYIKEIWVAEQFSKKV